jgi:hypothetical protein
MNPKLGHKNIILAAVVNMLFFIGCTPLTRQPDAEDQVVAAADIRWFFLDFVDKEDTEFSRAVVESVKSRLYTRQYVLTTDSNDWQGIREMNTADQVDEGNLTAFHRSRHRFADFSDYLEGESQGEKVVITINGFDSNGRPNFNYRSYKRPGSLHWELVFNPGTFTYHKTGKPDAADFAGWIVHKTVLLTFK